MTKADWYRWSQNTFLFLIPALLVVLSEGLKLLPENAEYGAVALYLVNILMDLLKKYKQEHTYRM